MPMLHNNLAPQLFAIIFQLNKSKYENLQIIFALLQVLVPQLLTTATSCGAYKKYKAAQAPQTLGGNVADGGGVVAATNACNQIITILNYFGNLSTVLIVHDGSHHSVLHQEYMEAVQQTFRNLSQRGATVALQWIDAGQLDDNAFEQQMLAAVDIVTEGFITVLPNTVRFLHARYYATRNAELRLKDKFYLFLCEHENPQDFLATEILQFYPHHLMITPGRSSSNSTVTAEPKQTTQITAARTLNKFTTDTSNNTNDDDKDEHEGEEHESSYMSDEQEGNTPMVAARAEPAEVNYCTSTNTNKPTTTTTTTTTTATSTSAHNFEMWTQKFVGAAGNLDALLLDSFLPNETFAENVELYPNKVTNLKGRTLRVGSITYIPYVVTNYVSPGTGNADPIISDDPNLSVSYLGSEAEIVKTFCEVLNCHLRVEAYGVDNWGFIESENESSAGMLGDIYTQHVEMAIGCIYNWYNNLTETSHTIARSAVTVLGPAPAQFPAWRTNLMPFTGELWTFLITTILLCALVVYSLKFVAVTKKNLKTGRACKFRHMETLVLAILDMFAVFIQQPSATTGLHSFASRFFLTTILCATITLENTYSGQLKSILTIPFFTDPVDTMDKWSQTPWNWGAPSIVWVQTVENSDLIKEQIMTKKFEVRDYNFLYNATFRSDYGFGIERLMSGSFSFGDFITAPALETKIVPKDDLYFDWTRAVSIRGWPLMPLFNRHVRSCMETGLFVHWERQIVAQYLDRQTQNIMLNLASDHNNKASPQNLNVENISGALFALLIGYVIALIIFCIELLVHSMKLKMLRSNIVMLFGSLRYD